MKGFSNAAAKPDRKLLAHNLYKPKVACQQPVAIKSRNMPKVCTALPASWQVQATKTPPPSERRGRTHRWQL